MERDAAIPPGESPAESPAPGDTIPGELVPGMNPDRALAFAMFERIRASHARHGTASTDSSPGNCLKDSNA
jgi:hypothetical protein